MTELHDRFARYAEVDEAIRIIVVKQMKENQHPHLPKETAVINEHLLFASKPWRRIPGTVGKSISFFRAASSESSAWGKTVADIDVAADVVFSWIWNYRGYERSVGNFAGNGDYALRVDMHVEGTHSMFQVNEARFKAAGVGNRVFANWWTWRREKRVLVAAFAPLESEC